VDGISRQPYSYTGSLTSPYKTKQERRVHFEEDTPFFLFCWHPTIPATGTAAKAMARFQVSAPEMLKAGSIPASNSAQWFEP
jgi:hypothetical protein